MNTLNLHGEKKFDDSKQIDSNGHEYWYARELMILLEYRKWENFHQVIKRAMIACEKSDNMVLDHFPEFRKMVEIGSNTKKRNNRLSSFKICLLSNCPKRKS